MWSEPAKQGLLKHHPGDDARRRLLVVRGPRHGPVGVVGRRQRRTTAKFTLGENTRVITEDGRDVEPGSGEIGRVAVGGYQPVGYYKDPEKTAAHLPRDRRRALLGARATSPRSRPTARSRCSAAARCASTPAARRSSPRRSRRSSRRIPSVRDAVAVGVPDEKFGEAITAVVELAARRRRSTRPSVIAHVKAQARRLQGAQARARGRHHRPGPQRQGRLQAPQGVRRRRRRGRLSRAPPRRPDEGRAAARRCDRQVTAGTVRPWPSAGSELRRASTSSSTTSTPRSSASSPS